MSFGDAYHRDSRVDHHVTHENYYACYYNTYGNDRAENCRQPDQRVCVAVMMSVYQFSSVVVGVVLVLVLVLVLGRLAMVAVGRRHLGRLINGSQKSTHVGLFVSFMFGLRRRSWGWQKLGQVGNYTKNWFFISNSWEGFGIFLS